MPVFARLFSLPALAAAILLALPLAAPAADMRECRLDALTFVDPWGGEEFTVTSVGLEERLLCPEGFIPSFAAQDPATCQGPYTSVFLFGQFSSRTPVAEPGSDPRAALAVWSVLPAAPCCGWELLPPSAFPADRWDGAMILTPGTAPPLGDFSFGAIEGDIGPLADLPPLLPLKCGHALE